MSNVTANLLKSLIKHRSIHCLHRKIQVLQQQTFRYVSWSYEESYDWGKVNPACNGHQQSPIAVSSSNTTYNPKLGNLNLTSYSADAINWLIHNNGHTVKVKPIPEDDRFIHGSNLNGRFKLSQFHFHWGDADDRGSEHTIDGTTYAMEMHLVHFAENYKNMSQAEKHADGIVVLAVLFMVVDEDNPSLEVITSNLKHVQFKGLKAPLDKLNLNKLLPGDQDHFYMYHGSFTTPPCLEVITWIVFHNPVTISHRQINEFRHLIRETYLHTADSSQLSPQSYEQSDSDLRLVDNYRSLQKINDRVVYSSVDTSPDFSAPVTLSKPDFVV